MLAGDVSVLVLSQDQKPALQLDALKAASCGKVFREKASGAHALTCIRPALSDDAYQTVACDQSLQFVW